MRTIIALCLLFDKFKRVVDLKKHIHQVGRSILLLLRIEQELLIREAERVHGIAHVLSQLNEEVVGTRVGALVSKIRLSLPLDSYHHLSLLIIILILLAINPVLLDPRDNTSRVVFSTDISIIASDILYKSGRVLISWSPILSPTLHVSTIAATIALNFVV